MCEAHLEYVIDVLRLEGYEVFIVKAFEGQSSESPVCGLCRVPADWIEMAET